jgi:NifU-like protein involved in Fe-S cluster formation
MHSKPLDSLYSSALIELAHSYGSEKMLENADVALERQSKLCGSVVQMSLRFDNNILIEKAISADADALGRAACAILQGAMQGKNILQLRQVIKAANEAVRHDQPIPDQLKPQWQGLEQLRAIHAFPNRQSSTLLAFEVLEACLDQYEDKAL